MKKIEFVSTVAGLDMIEECRPKPAKSYIPKWFKDIPSDARGSVKYCPSFPDFFSQGYVMPMWVDSKIKYDAEQDIFSWDVAHNEFSWTGHGHSQFTNHKVPSFFGLDASFVFKTISPWRIITPPGWSVLQLPLFYHFNKQWSIMPGIIDTDMYNETNHQVLYHGNGEEVIIEQGEPFCLYIPFERKSKLGLEIREQTEQDKKMFNSRDLRMKSKFINSGIYRSMQRRRDKNG